MSSFWDSLLPAGRRIHNYTNLAPAWKANELIKISLKRWHCIIMVLVFLRNTILSKGRTTTTRKKKLAPLIYTVSTGLGRAQMAAVKKNHRVLTKQ